MTKRKSRHTTEVSYLRKDHFFKIITSAVTEIKDFEQRREPFCFAIKTKKFPRKNENSQSALLSQM